MTLFPDSYGSSVAEANDCHLPAGRPDGGQFCSSTSVVRAYDDYAILRFTGAFPRGRSESEPQITLNGVYNVEGRRYLRVESVFVPPAARRRGIATALYRAAAEHAKAQGFAGIASYEGGRNSMSSALWQGMAQRKLGVRRHDKFMLMEANDCHLLAGRPDGGQFCSKTGVAASARLAYPKEVIAALEECRRFTIETGQEMAIKIEADGTRRGVKKGGRGQVSVPGAWVATSGFHIHSHPVSPETLDGPGVSPLSLQDLLTSFRMVPRCVMVNVNGDVYEVGPSGEDMTKGPFGPSTLAKAVDREIARYAHEYRDVLDYRRKAGIDVLLKHVGLLYVRVGKVARITMHLTPTSQQTLRALATREQPLFDRLVAGSREKELRQTWDAMISGS